MYKSIIRPILFLFDPEKIHNIFVAPGGMLGNFPPGRRVLSLLYNYKGADISKVVDGIRYRIPIILSAGFDYNARLTRILPYLSFGGVEVGSITAYPCAGNPKPCLARLVKSKSILVNKGLRNEGVDAIVKKLKRKQRERNFVIGISVAKTNDVSTCSIERGLEDYCTSFKKLTESGVGDYYAINISCPNAYGSESFAEPDSLDILLKRLEAIPCLRPIYLKMPINLPWEKFNQLLRVATKYRINGVIIGNLNKNYDDLDFREEAPREYRGGVSGKPCFLLSNHLIRKTRKQWKNRFTIIGCGGVMSADEAVEKLTAGADLIELITGIIFEGPGLIKKICRAIAKTR